MFKAVCFDFDYTLGDCTDSIVAGFQYGLTGLGWPAPDRETVRGTIGYMLEDAYTMLTGDADPGHQAKFRALFSEVAVERQRRETILFPGAPELLRGLKARGVRTAIVSTKRGDTIEIIMDNHGLGDTVELVIGSADVKRPKPDPEGLRTAMDAGAAQNAGCHFAAVLNGLTPAEGFAGFAPDHIAPDLWELARWLGVEI